MTPNLSRIVHDMRTRLAAIIGYAELLDTRRNAQTLAVAPQQILEAAHLLSDEIDKLVRPTLDAELQLQAEEAARRRDDFPRRRVVVADEDPLVRQLLGVTLSVDVFDVVEAADGLECLVAVEREQPELVVLDWLIPRVSGSQVLAELKASWPMLPVVVLTDSIEGHLAGPAELGADALLTKPFSPLQLLAEIEQLLPERVAHSSLR